MRAPVAAFAAVLGAAAPASAGKLFDTAAEHAAFATELRAALLANPEIVDAALNPAVPSGADIYRDARDADLSLIRDEAARLFGPGPRLGAEDAPVALAFITDGDCEGCADAEAALVALLSERGLAARRIDAASPEGRALTERLTLDALPSYVLPHMMVRGQIPPFVLARYLDD